MATQCISSNTQTLGPGIQGPLHSDLKLSKRHFMLLYFPLSALHFSRFLPVLEFTECFPLLASLPYTFFPLGTLSLLLRLAVKILRIVQGPHSPWNLPNLCSLLTFWKQPFRDSSHDIYFLPLCVYTVWGRILWPLLAIHFVRAGPRSNSFRYLLSQGWTNYGPWTKSHLLSGFVNRILLENSHAC